MECVIHNRKIKYEDGEVYWWYSHCRRRPVKNPRWIMFKQTITKTRSKQYKTIEIKGRKYKVHRVIYKIHNNDWNIDDNSNFNLIDHIDRNTSNNNIENLRVLNNSQNNCNRDCKGYYWHKKANKWCVEITINYKKIYGGLFINEEDAIKRREEMKEKYHKIN